MSNQNLLIQLQDKLASLRRKEATYGDLAQALRTEGHALEAIPYWATKEIDSMVHDLQIAQWAVDEGCLPDSGSLIAQAEELFRKIAIVLSQSQP